MKRLTNELTGPALDWAAATAEYTDGRTIYADLGLVLVHTSPGSGVHLRFMPSVNWSQGGPIAERERISYRYENQMAYHPGGAIGQGTELIAKMRCFVASRLGSEVDIPEELV